MAPTRSRCWRSGAITVDGLIGGTTALTSLSMDGQTVTLNGIGTAGNDGVTGTVSVTGGNGITLDEGTYHSGGTQTWNGAVALGADTAVTSDSGSVTFTSTINGAHALSALASGANHGRRTHRRNDGAHQAEHGRPDRDAERDRHRRQ